MTTATISGQPTRELFGTALRRWRELRRISQLELALRAGTTQRHLSFIERGRSAPGRALVVRLAESLDLPLRERNLLLLNAGYAPAYAESTLGDKEMVAVRDALDTILNGHDPYPAMVIDRAGELLLANRACGLFFDDLPARLLQAPINTRRVALDPDGLAGRITNFVSWAPHVTDSLRREIGINPDVRLQSLLQELEAYLPAQTLRPDDFGFAVPLELATDDGPVRLITTITTFATASDVFLAELRMEAFLPADQDTAALLHRRAAARNPNVLPRPRRE